MKQRLCSFLVAMVMLVVMCPLHVSAADAYLWPVPASKTITQNFKSGSHLGLDIGGSKGTDIVATKGGTVFYVYSGCINNNAASSSGVSCTSKGCNPNCGTYAYGSKRMCNWGYGNGVIIKHSDGSGYSMYAHMQTVTVKKGQTVSQGTKIGTMGSSGNSTGTHLHFELTGSVQQSGTYYKPTATINSNTSSISYIYSVKDPGGDPPPPPSAKFSLPTQSSYSSKQWVGETNAVIVNQITKPAGTPVSKMGAYIYDEKGTQLKKYTEDVSKLVGVNTTTYHSWYDVNKEIGLKLEPGTKYQYRFFGVFNGKEITGPLYSFTTKGTPAPKSFQATFWRDDIGSTTQKITVTQGKAYGTLPQPLPKEGYTFVGWFTHQSGGSQITSSTVFNGSANVTLYPQWTKDPEPEPEPEPEIFTVYFYDTYDMSLLWTRQVQNGGTYQLSDPSQRENSTFLGWFTEDGDRIYNGQTVSLSADLKLYAQWETIEVEPEPEPVKTFTISFYDGMNMTLLSREEVQNGQLYPLPSVPQKDGYEFQGWYSTYGERITSSSVVNLDADQWVYARWTEVEEPEITPPEPDQVRIQLTINQSHMIVNDRMTMIDSEGTTPIIYNGRTLLPLRAVMEAMGGSVGWNGSTQTVSVQCDGKMLFLQINNSVAWDNQGQTHALDAAPVIVNGRTMLPIRFVVEYFGGTVQWNGTTQTVTILYG